jgi:hypothetical protein
MTTLSANTPRRFQGPEQSVTEYPVDANLRVFAGAALIQSTVNGCAILATPTASGEFLGFSTEEKDNRTGSVFGGTAASTTVAISQKGLAWLTVAHTSTYARTDYGVTVYASDDDTFTLSAGTNNIVVGKLVLIPDSVVGAATGEVLVAFEATGLRSI